MSLGVPSEGKVPTQRNQVHYDQNWTQRVKNEEQTEEHWNKNWGFMTTHTLSKDSDRVLKYASDEELHRRKCELTTTNKFVRTLKGDRDFNRSSGLPSSYRDNLDSLPPQNQIATGKTLPRTPMNSLAGEQFQALRSTNPYTDAVERKHRTNPNSLDVGLAVSMQKQSLHAIGYSMELPGVDPAQKYQYPLTSSQHVGWRAYNSLEMFGVAQHGKHRINFNEK